MGVVTPFPEPESPELRRFEISARPQILELLRRMCSEATQVSLFDPGGADFDIVALRRIDDAAGQIDCDVLDARPGSRFRRDPVEATFVGFTGGHKVQFNATGATLTERTSPCGLSVRLPETLLLLSRRQSERVLAGSRAVSACRLRLPDGMWANQPIAVHDLSAGGLAVDVVAETDKLTVGARIDGCRLDLPGCGGMQVTLTIRHWTELQGAEPARRVGFAYFQPSPALLAAVERFVAGSRPA